METTSPSEDDGAGPDAANGGGRVATVMRRLSDMAAELQGVPPRDATDDVLPTGSGAPGRAHVGRSGLSTPAELRRLEFERVRRGYDPAKVDRVIERIMATLEETWIDRGQLAERVQQLEEELHRRGHPANGTGDGNGSAGNGRGAARRSRPLHARATKGDEGPGIGDAMTVLDKLLDQAREINARLTTRERVIDDLLEEVGRLRSSVQDTTAVDAATAASELLETTARTLTEVVVETADKTDRLGQTVTDLRAVAADRDAAGRIEAGLTGLRAAVDVLAPSITDPARVDAVVSPVLAALSEHGIAARAAVAGTANALTTLTFEVAALSAAIGDGTRHEAQQRAVDALAHEAHALRAEVRALPGSDDLATVLQPVVEELAAVRAMTADTSAADAVERRLDSLLAETRAVRAVVDDPTPNAALEQRLDTLLAESRATREAVEDPRAPASLERRVDDLAAALGVVREEVEDRTSDIAGLAALEKMATETATLRARVEWLVAGTGSSAGSDLDAVVADLGGRLEALAAAGQETLAEARAARTAIEATGASGAFSDDVAAIVRPLADAVESVRTGLADRDGAAALAGAVDRVLGEVRATRAALSSLPDVDGHRALLDDVLAEARLLASHVPAGALAAQSRLLEVLLAESRTIRGLLADSPALDEVARRLDALTAETSALRAGAAGNVDLAEQRRLLDALVASTEDVKALVEEGAATADLQRRRLDDLASEASTVRNLLVDPPVLGEQRRLLHDVVAETRAIHALVDDPTAEREQRRLLHEVLSQARAIAVAVDDPPAWKVSRRLLSDLAAETGAIRAELRERAAHERRQRARDVVRATRAEPDGGLASAFAATVE